MKTYTLELTLVESKPKIWRELKLPGRYKLSQLHKMMQILFDWQDYHLHEFQFGDTLYTDLDTLDGYDRGEEDHKIPFEQALGNLKTFQYRYDFGDSWEVKARVKATEEGDLDSPECLAGERAGPPEDCGGIPGLEELNKILKNKKHPEYEHMRTWAGNYDPTRFRLSSVNKELKKKHGRKTKKKKTPKDAVLSGYQLHKLTYAQMVVAALEEKTPRTLEEVAERLESVGVPLNNGLETLRRSLAKTDAIRQRTDGALEIAKSGKLSETTRFMHLYKVDFHIPQPETPKPPPMKEGPLTPEEVERAYLPWSISVRRLLTMAVDALGGKAKVEDAIELLRPNCERFKRTPDIEASLRGSQHLTLTDGVLELDRDHEQTKKAREEVRSRIPAPKDLEAEQVQKAMVAQRQAERINAGLERRDKFQRARKAVLAGSVTTPFAIMDTASGEVHYLDREQAPLLLKEFDYLIGLDPKTLIEKRQWDLELECIDITPPFKSIAVSRNRRQPLSVDKAIKMSLGRTVDPKNWKQLARARDADKLEKTLRKDVITLYELYRFGVIHGALLREGEWMPVNWNLGLELHLTKAMEISAAQQSPLHLVRKNRFAGKFQPTKLLRDYDWYYARGEWVDSGVEETVKFPEVIDFSYDFEVTRAVFEEYAWFEI